MLLCPLWHHNGRKADSSQRCIRHSIPAMQSEQEKVKEGHFSFLEGTLREQRQKKITRVWPWRCVRMFLSTRVALLLLMSDFEIKTDVWTHNKQRSNQLPRRHVFPLFHCSLQAAVVDIIFLRTNTSLVSDAGVFTQGDRPQRHAVSWSPSRQIVWRRLLNPISVSVLSFA